MYRKYYSINDMPQMIQPNTPDNKHTQEAIQAETGPEIQKNIEEELGIIQDGKLLGKYELDDIILIAIAFMLLVDDCDDKLLLLALGFIFVSGIL